MFENFVLNTFFQPVRLRLIGLLMSKIGSVITVIGLFLQVLIQGLTKLKSVGQLNPNTTRVESLLPGIPTGFVPESTEGFVFWILFTALGLYCQHMASVLKRYYG